MAPEPKVAKVAYNIPIDLIVVGENQRGQGNVGFTDKSLKALAKSIGDDGLTNPITLRPVSMCPECTAVVEDREVEACPDCNVALEDRYRLVAGERRFRSISKFLDWETIPAFVQDMDHITERAVMAHENIGRVDLDPIEEAEVYREFTETHELTTEETAERCGTTKANVLSRLRLLNLIPQARQMVSNGQIPLTHADAMADLSESLQQEALKLLGRTSPTFVQFKQYLTQLESEQNEQLDLTAFWIEQVESAADTQKTMRSGQAQLITDDSLPQVRGDRKDTAGDIMVRYMFDLNEAGHAEAAAAVGNLLQVMLKLRKVKNFRETLIPELMNGG